MEIQAASERLAALGHETRLAIFRLLVQAGATGVSAGVIGERLGLAAATLSFHLAHLSRVGLIKGRAESRYIFYVADFEAMDQLLSLPRRTGVPRAGRRGSRRRRFLIIPSPDSECAVGTTARPAENYVTPVRASALAHTSPPGRIPCARTHGPLFAQLGSSA